MRSISERKSTSAISVARDDAMKLSNIWRQFDSTLSKSLCTLCEHYRCVSAGGNKRKGKQSVGVSSDLPPPIDSTSLTCDSPDVIHAKTPSPQLTVRSDAIPSKEVPLQCLPSTSNADEWFESSHTLDPPGDLPRPNYCTLSPCIDDTNTLTQHIPQQLQSTQKKIKY